LTTDDKSEDVLPCVFVSAKKTLHYGEKYGREDMVKPVKTQFLPTPPALSALFGGWSRRNFIKIIGVRKLKTAFNVWRCSHDAAFSHFIVSLWRTNGHRTSNTGPQHICRG